MLDSVSELSVKKESDSIKEDNKNILLREIDIRSVKELFLKEIDVPKLKKTLVEDIKTSLLKEVDVSSIKEVLTKDIVIKELVSGKGNTQAPVSSTFEDPANKKLDLPAYRYGLIESFIEEHQEILSIYENILKNAKDREYTTMPLMLSNFSKKCLKHFNGEEELYNFMKVLASSRSKIERKVAREFSIEMKNLSVSLFTILNQSNYIPVTDNTVDGFIREFEELGSLLQERISREEKILYPMYENSRKVVDIS